ncbi:MAG: prolyl oligopeptidase family serine peptidase [Lachnospiraceae bacterium]|nr:prolyl oligopeptidase family serine peptidase [Lachnospiraceae bacterium]
MISVDNAFKEYETDNQETFPEIFELNIISGGCHLYGYLLTPDKRVEGPHPTIIMSHGFPGYTTNNDLELAFMRMGCVVIHMNHRGAWGSEGEYLFTNLKEDLIAVAKWAHNSAVADRYDIDVNNIFLVGHSMGGQSVLNAAKDISFIKGVAALAAYDIGAAFRYNMEKDLFLMIETEGQCLKMTSASEVYENALLNQHELSVLNRAEELVKRNVLLVEATFDTIAPPDKMLKPLADKLKADGGNVKYESIGSNHSFIGQRMKLTNTVGKWIEENSR